MILAPEELRRLVELKHPSPHAVLGMHPLADGSGVVVRAFLPKAGKVEVHALGEKSPPPFELQRIHQKDGVFEGVTTGTPHCRNATNSASSRHTRAGPG